MNQTQSIRPATEADIPAIQTIARRAWEAAFHVFLTPQQMAFDLAREYSTEALQRQINTLRHSFYLLCVEPDEAVGFASVAPEPDEPGVLKLHKLYLQPEAKGSGQGSRLLEFVIDLGRNQGFQTLRLLVNRSNEATRFYLKHGFQIVRELDSDIGNGYMRHDYVMEKFL